MAKKKESNKLNEQFSNVDGFCNSLEKKYGNILLNTEEKDTNVKFVTTNIVSLDNILGGGLPQGRIIEIFGPESCLDKDTLVKCYISEKDGTGNAHKTWTLERLYERFHNINAGGQGKYLRDKTKNYEFQIASINEDNCVFRNKIIDVVLCGGKECFKLTTNDGFTITASSDHKFFDGVKYVPLKHLAIGSRIYIHNNTHFKNRNKIIVYKEVGLKWHPTASWQLKNNCLSFPIKYCNLVYEAFMNKVSTVEYKALLNSRNEEFLKKVWTIPKGYEIHHRDSNSKNDGISNLQLMEQKEHHRMHALINHNKLRFVVVPNYIIKIEKIGVRITYDVKCLYPYNNYIANNFVVHNSGKSTLAMHIMGVTQKLGGTACLVDAEYAYDKDYATGIGVDTNLLKIVQPENAQQALGAVEEMILSNLFDIIVVDSVAALVPKEEVEGEMGDSHMGLQARLMSQALRKLSGIVSKSKCRLIFINQIRMKIGIMFGNPETTTGGNALKFYSSIRLDVRKIEFLGLKERPTGIRQKVKCVKNKVAPPFRQTELNLYFNTGYDIASDVFEYADSFGIITHEGRSLLFNGERIGVNDAEVIINIKNNKELRVNLKKQVKESFLQQG